jgi:uncharacterized protein (DUF885 family)
MTVSTIATISHDYIESMAALDPITATSWGVSGHDHRLTDYSPDGLTQRGDLQRSTLTKLRSLVPATDEERIATAVMTERLESALLMLDRDELARPLRVLFSPFGQIRSCFDLMKTDTPQDWDLIRSRLDGVPHALSSLRELLEQGISRSVVGPTRQTIACAVQGETWGNADTGFFSNLARRAPNHLIDAEADAAAAAYRSLAEWLRSTYAPRGSSHDPVGVERYETWCWQMNGAQLDLVETYEWGWSELRRIEGRMAELADRIVPGGSINEAIAHVEADPRYVIEGVDSFQRWNQSLIDTTIASMHGVHFDIADPIQRCEAMIAPPGGAAAMYYTGPSEDFTRPGRTWYPTLGKTRFPLWREVSICYHEGVPGHHLQIAQVKYSKTLTRFQRLAGNTSAHVEGWALYAEHLMHELGHLDDPVFELGMLSCQAMRSVRVIVDIGMHLELKIPADSDYAPGATWTPELALPFVIERSRFPQDFMASEIDRYLGMPCQAITYKVGERAWLEGRSASRARRGASFDLKSFHRDALNLGSMGLGQLTSELARL